MSFTTRCPACGTMFRVVADQLKISDGWVRCGHCAGVFDATLSLDAWDAAPSVGSPPADPHAGVREDVAAEQAPVPTAPGVTSLDFELPDPVVEAPMVPAPETEPEPEPAPKLEPVPEPEPKLEPQPQPELERTAHPEDNSTPSCRDVSPTDPPGVTEAPQPAPALDTASALAEPSAGAAPTPPPPPPVLTVQERPVTGLVPLLAVESGPDVHPDQAQAASDASGMSEPMPLVAPESVSLEPAPLNGPTALPEPIPSAVVVAAPQPEPLPEPGFVRQARRRAFWRTPAVRAVLASLALLLSIVLAGQWAFHERDPLAARYPGLRPWLDQLCEPLGCRVEPARDIDAIVIDSTALVQRQGNAYSFDLVLKNTSPMALAMPALELSLTNNREDVIARRVFLPHELPGAPAVLPAQASVSISLRLSLAVGDALPMTGYRALVFYP